MEGNHILYAIRDKTCIIKMVGEIRHTVASGFEAVLELSFRGDKVDSFLFDLTEAIYLDSTNLGLMAQPVAWCREKGFIKPTLVSTNEEVTVILRSMGFEDVFLLVDQPLTNLGKLEESEAHEESLQEKTRLIYKAHKTLMELNEKNREEFKSVVELLEQEVEEKEGGS